MSLYSLSRQQVSRVGPLWGGPWQLCLLFPETHSWPDPNHDSAELGPKVPQNLLREHGFLLAQ